MDCYFTFYLLVFFVRLGFSDEELCVTEIRRSIDRMSFSHREILAVLMLHLQKYLIFIYSFVINIYNGGFLTRVSILFGCMRTKVSGLVRANKTRSLNKS